MESKYKEIIESYGFVYDNDSNSFKLWNKHEMYELLKTDDIYNIERHYQTALVARVLPFSTWDNFNIFNGTISNPQELKVILKQVGIIKE